MSIFTTYVTGRRVAAFINEDGRVIYALFDRTYTHRNQNEGAWLCRAIGSFDHILGAILRLMYACESSLRNYPNQPILPESELLAWQRLLSSPMRLPDQQIVVGVPGALELSPEMRKKAVRALTCAGHFQIADQLTLGPIALSLYKDTEAVLALIGVTGVLSPVSAISCTNPLPAKDIPSQTTAKQSLPGLVDPVYTVLVVDDVYTLVSFNGRPFEIWGWTYQAVQRFIALHCLPMERSKRLSSITAIAKFRDLCRSAPAAPLNMEVAIHMPPREEAWSRQCFADLAASLGTNGAGQIKLTLADAIASGVLPTICRMPSATWKGPASVEIENHSRTLPIAA